jgi:hypothetical protein
MHETPSDMRRTGQPSPSKLREGSASAWCTHVYYIGPTGQIQEGIEIRLQFVDGPGWNRNGLCPGSGLILTSLGAYFARLRAGVPPTAPPEGPDRGV